MNVPVPAKLIAATFLSATLAACGGGDSADAGATQDSAAATAAPFDSGAAAAPAVPAAPAPAATTGMLDPNAAPREQLLGVPGVTPALADALVAGRPFQDMTAVDKVLAGQNLTEQQRDSVYTRLWKPLDLNKASKEEILLIPGVGPRMQHEFEEYRPYRNIEQFRREIGKYVNEQEVARLEQYVTIAPQ
jgi:DNA uptake protein ComE-like DNA-binding protein